MTGTVWTSLFAMNINSGLEKRSLVVFWVFFALLTLFVVVMIVQSMRYFTQYYIRSKAMRWMCFASGDSDVCALNCLCVEKKCVMRYVWCAYHVVCMNKTNYIGRLVSYLHQNSGQNKSKICDKYDPLRSFHTTTTLTSLFISNTTLTSLFISNTTLKNRHSTHQEHTVLLLLQPQPW